MSDDVLDPGNTAVVGKMKDSAWSQGAYTTLIEESRRERL